MKILLVNSLYYPNEVGGAEKSTREIAEYFASEHDVTVACTDMRNRNYQLNGVNIRAFKILNLYNLQEAQKKSIISKIVWRLLDIYNVQAFFEFKAFISDLKPDVIHFNNIAGFSPSIIRACSKIKARKVLTLRDYYLFCSRSNMFKNGKACSKVCWECKCIRLPNKYLTKNIDVVTSVSAFMDKIVVSSDYFDVAKREVVYNCVNESQSRISRELGNQSALISLGFLGAVRKEKGIEIFVETPMPEYCDRIVAGRLYPPFSKSYFKRYNISYLGVISKEVFFTQISILVVPSVWNEPFGRVVIEAFSYGLPVFAFANGGLTELIEPNVNGFILDDSMSNLRDALQWYREMDKMELQKNCRKCAREFSVDETMLRYRSIYED